MAHRSNVEKSDPQLQNLAFMRFDLTPRADASHAKLLLLLLSNNNNKKIINTNKSHRLIFWHQSLISIKATRRANQNFRYYHIVIFHWHYTSTSIHFLLHSVDASENDQMKWNIFRFVNLILKNTFHSKIPSGRCSSDWLFVWIQKPNSVINVHFCICIVSEKNIGKSDCCAADLRWRSITSAKVNRK